MPLLALTIPVSLAGEEVESSWSSFFKMRFEPSIGDIGDKSGSSRLGPFAPV